MEKTKIKALVQYGLTGVFTVLALALMACDPDFFSAFGYMSWFDGETLACIVMFLIVLVLSSLLIVSSLVGVTGVLIDNKKLNMTLVNKILSIALTVFALVGMILAIVCSSCGAGAVCPFVFAALATFSSFIFSHMKKA